MDEKLNLMVVDTTTFLEIAAPIISELAGDRFEVFKVNNVSQAISMLRSIAGTDALIMSPNMHEAASGLNSAVVLQVARGVGVGSIAFMTGLEPKQFERMGMTVFDKTKMGEDAENEKIRAFLQRVKS